MGVFTNTARTNRAWSKTTKLRSSNFHYGSPVAYWETGGNIQWWNGHYYTVSVTREIGANGSVPVVGDHLYGIYMTKTRTISEIAPHFSSAKTAFPPQKGGVKIWSPAAGEFGQHLLSFPTYMMRFTGASYSPTKWFIYYLTWETNGPGDPVRIGVLESLTTDPMGPWINHGRLGPSQFSINNAFFEVGGNLYVVTGIDIPNTTLLETGESVQMGHGLAIQRMTNPWTLATNSWTQMRPPERLWETWLDGGTRHALNEPDNAIVRNNKIHLFFSANHVMNTDYATGLMTYDIGTHGTSSAAVMTANNWTKRTTPFLPTDANMWRSGQSFLFKSPDASTDYIGIVHEPRWRSNWPRSTSLAPLAWDGSDMPSVSPPAPGKIYPEPPGTILQDSFSGTTMSPGVTGAQISTQLLTTDVKLAPGLYELDFHPFSGDPTRYRNCIEVPDNRTFDFSEATIFLKPNQPLAGPNDSTPSAGYAEMIRSRNNSGTTTGITIKVGVLDGNSANQVSPDCRFGGIRISSGLNCTITGDVNKFGIIQNCRGTDGGGDGSGETFTVNLRNPRGGNLVRYIWSRASTTAHRNQSNTGPACNGRVALASGRRWDPTYFDDCYTSNLRFHAMNSWHTDNVVRRRCVAEGCLGMGINNEYGNDCRDEECWVVNCVSWGMSKLGDGTTNTWGKRYTSYNLTIINSATGGGVEPIIANGHNGAQFHGRIWHTDNTFLSSVNNSTSVVNQMTWQGGTTGAPTPPRPPNYGAGP